MEKEKEDFTRESLTLDERERLIFLALEGKEKLVCRTGGVTGKRVSLAPSCCIQLYDSCALATLVPLTLSKHINSPLPPVLRSLSLSLSGLGPHGNRFETRLDVDSSPLSLPFYACWSKKNRCSESISDHGIAIHASSCSV